jgi:hypothetical protein
MMEQQYQTKAREVWEGFLKYDKKDRAYRYYINFMYGNWGQPNQVVLIFDKKGNFIKTEPFVDYKFRKKTIEETKEDHMLFALNFKETAEKFIKALIKPIEKEAIIFHLENSWVDETELIARFDIGELSYCYNMNWENPCADQLLSALKENGEYYFMHVYDIPSLKEVRSYIRTHPKIRVKYVNELAQYEKNRL